MQAILLANQMGAGIPYPYENVPIRTIGDRYGVWTIIGAGEELNKILSGKKKKESNTIEINAGEQE